MIKKRCPVNIALSAHVFQEPLKNTIIWSQKDSTIGALCEVSNYGEDAKKMSGEMPEIYILPALLL